ncbi:glycosyltransferase [Aquamicrobium sp. LC103]|uniref:glycosyltransferase n=1 Tax=Aquamicrobium sp. LC103 TaxID=1120658 RepID=UPI00063EC6AA|nr:glycosyltransferase [Aquamicrobium sp. LC103]TKT69331.1 glycosyl transferase family 1 [Aquamicrobium sp. LC103]
MLHILYIVHDVSDPAVRRRVKMLRTGGAEIVLAGFRRTQEPVADIEGIRPIDLGATQDGRFAQRLLAVAGAALSIRSKFGKLAEPDLVIARNLEMLALARRAKAAFGWRETPLVYECLDIHRLVLRPDVVGRAMRGAERLLARDARLLMTSSPAFVANYFQRYGQVSAPIELVENKHLELSETAPPRSAANTPPPWRIGWFGALRCRKSLELLARFTRAEKGRYEVILRGRPALSEFPDFHGFVEAEPYLTFAGPYRNPEDIAEIYGGVHFSWAIDFFEEGQNSEWLLPNRLYEGCRFGAIPITMSGTETARHVGERGIGVELPEATPAAISAALSAIDVESHGAMRTRVLAAGPGAWSYDAADCRALVARLSTLGKTPRPYPAGAGIITDSP